MTLRSFVQSLTQLHLQHFDVMTIHCASRACTPVILCSGVVHCGHRLHSFFRANSWFLSVVFCIHHTLLQIDIFAKFRTEDTSWVDSCVGSTKRAAFVCWSRNAPIRPQGSALELARKMQGASIEVFCAVSIIHFRIHNLNWQPEMTKHVNQLPQCH